MDDTTRDNAAAALGQAIGSLERAALDAGSAAATIRGRQVRAIAHAQTRGSRTTRRVCWELEGAGISRAHLLAALNGGRAPARELCSLCGTRAEPCARRARGEPCPYRSA